MSGGPNGGDTAFGLRRGDRIRLISTTDPHPPPPGSTGTVTGWNTDPRFAQVWVRWDDPTIPNLNLIPDIDHWETLPMNTDTPFAAALLEGGYTLTTTLEGDGDPAYSIELPSADAAILITNPKRSGLPEPGDKVLVTLWRDASMIESITPDDPSELLDAVEYLHDIAYADPADVPTIDYVPDNAAAPTAADVIAALEAGLETAEVWLAAGGLGDRADAIRVYNLIRELQKRGGRLSEVAEHAKTVIATENFALEVDGQWWRSKRKPSRRGYDKEALRSAINRKAREQRPIVDYSTGEVDGVRDPSTDEVVDVIWQAADVAVGRTKVLREQFDIDLDEYAETTWGWELEPVEYADLTPEQRGETDTEAGE